MELTYTTTQVDGQSEYDLFGMAKNEDAEEIGQIIHKISVEFSYDKTKRNIVGWKEL